MAQTTDPERQRELQEVALKVAGVILGIALVVGIGSWLMVRTLGLDETTSGPIGSGPVQPVTPLPTTALPVPSESITDDAEDDPSFTAPPDVTNEGLHLNGTPVFVRPMERINLTGNWAGKDAVGLQVQRLEGGKWVDFGVQVTVNVGTFETFVMTGRSGDNRFRVFDPASNTASNPVRITVD